MAIHHMKLFLPYLQTCCRTSSLPLTSPPSKLALPSQATLYLLLLLLTGNYSLHLVQAFPKPTQHNRSSHTSKPFCLLQPYYLHFIFTIKSTFLSFPLYPSCLLLAIATVPSISTMEHPFHVTTYSPCLDFLLGLCA